MSIYGTRCYSASVLEDAKIAYQSLTHLFRESYDDAYDSYGVLVDESSWEAHKKYAQALYHLGSVITNLREAGDCL